MKRNGAESDEEKKDNRHWLVEGEKAGRDRSNWGRRRRRKIVRE